MNIIEISKYNRVITDSRITRLVSSHELLLVYLYHHLQVNWNRDTLIAVENNVSELPLFDKGDSITFNYKVDNEGGTTEDVRVKMTCQGEAKITTSVSPSQESEMTQIPNFKIRKNKLPIKQYVYSNGVIGNTILENENINSKAKYNLDHRLELDKIPIEVLTVAQEMLKPASMGMDLRPIYHANKPDIVVRAQVGLARHILLALEQSRTILILDNINIGVQDSQDDNMISELLKVSSRHINIYYTKRKNKGGSTANEK